MMMRSVFRPLQEKWDNEKMGVTMRTSGQPRDFAENCYLFAASRQEIKKMIKEVLIGKRMRWS